MCDISDWTPPNNPYYSPNDEALYADDASDDVSAYSEPEKSDNDDYASAEALETRPAHFKR